MKIKEYTYYKSYKGQQITLKFCAKNKKEVAKLLNVTSYIVNTYVSFTYVEKHFEGILAFFDSGYLFNNRPDLINVLMPYQDLIKLIDFEKNKSPYLIDIIDLSNGVNILNNPKHGGTRKGAGAKPKYSEQTKTVAFRCPLSKVDELKKIINAKLNEWKS